MASTPTEPTAEPASDPDPVASLYDRCLEAVISDDLLRATAIADRIGSALADGEHQGHDLDRMRTSHRQLLGMIEAAMDKTRQELALVRRSHKALRAYGSTQATDASH